MTPSKDGRKITLSLCCVFLTLERIPMATKVNDHKVHGKKVPAVRVQEGDTAWTIAKNNLKNHDPNRWIEIVQLNPEIFARMQLVKPGDILAMPDDVVDPPQPSGL